MKLRRITYALSALLLVGLASPAIAQDNGGDSMSHDMDKSGQMTDATFMRHAAADSLAEIQMGRIALDKSSSAQVKQLAQRIIDDHSMANQKLMTIAERKQVRLPTEPMPMQKQEADQLKSLSGTTFDQAYARTMVKDHRKAIKMFGMESQNATDGDLKQFASTTLPVLKQHLQMAEQIAGNGGMRGNQGMGDDNSMNHADGTPMDTNSDATGMPATASSAY